jgi:FKBP-type peptidyl-prolyl cis-trans isomerase
MPTYSRILLLLTALLTIPFTAQATELKTTEQKYSYAIGYTLARQVQSKNIEIDQAAFTEAIQDVLQGRPQQMTRDEMILALDAGQRAMAKARADAAQRNLEVGNKFLAENKNKEGVVELPNGLQYQVLKKGEGASPKVEDAVTVHYRGTFIDGREFDRSREGNPVIFKLSGVIPGFSEAITRMQPGAKWRIFIPSNLGYGVNGAPPTIPPNETLIFEIELVSVKSSAPVNPSAQAKEQ